MEDSSYSRLKLLAKTINDFIKIIPNEEKNHDGFEMILLARDKKNNVALVQSLLNEEDIRESTISCIDGCLSNGLIYPDKNKMEAEILNGFAEYFMRLCIRFPELYKNFLMNIEALRPKDKNKANC